MQNHIFCLLLYHLQSVEATVFMRANTDSLRTQEQTRDVLLALETADLTEKGNIQMVFVPVSSMQKGDISS